MRRRIETPQAPRSGKEGSGVTPEARAARAKTDTPDCVKTRSLCSKKDLVQGLKGRTCYRPEKMFANHTSGKGLVLTVHRELSKLNGPNQIMQLERRQKTQAGRPRDTVSSTISQQYRREIAPCVDSHWKPGHSSCCHPIAQPPCMKLGVFLDNQTCTCPYDQLSSLLYICPREMKTYVRTELVHNCSECLCS